MYPVMLDVAGQRCLVVGGGGVALRKVDGLLAEGAVITLVAPAPVPALERLGVELAVELERRAYVPGEAADYALVFAATDDREVNRQVYRDSKAAGVWVNVADDPELCTFHLPARVRRGTLQLAIASAGEAPFVVRRLRQMLERRFGPEWGEWVAAAGRFRTGVYERHLARSDQEQRFDTFFAETVDGESLRARVPSAEEEQAWLEGRAPQRKDPTENVPRTGRRRDVALPEAGAGFVSLVGAGPGDPGLLTLRGRRRLLAADAVVYDRLAATAIPCDLPATVELHCVGKQASQHPVPQEEINALLVRLGKEGKRVVRLKGGDPFVFGRGGEEAEELARAGIPFEIVPCVTAGIAVPAYAGIPVTHRREVVRLTIVTAHEASKRDGPQVRWDLLAADPHATILGYMGVTYLERVVKELLGSGMDPRTPAAMIQQGTTSGQRMVRSTVADLPQAVKRAGLRPPGLFVIGPTVRHADLLEWFSRRPLFGERLVIPAPAGELGGGLELAGAELVELPLPVRPAARVVMDALPLSGCVVKSADEVELLDDERSGACWGEGVVAWCVGPAAADRARRLGWKLVEELPEGVGVAEVVAAVLAKHP